MIDSMDDIYKTSVETLVYALYPISINNNVIFAKKICKMISVNKGQIGFEHKAIMCDIIEQTIKDRYYNLSMIIIKYYAYITGYINESFINTAITYDNLVIAVYSAILFNEFGLYLYPYTWLSISNSAITLNNDRILKIADGYWRDLTTPPEIYIRDSTKAPKIIYQHLAEIIELEKRRP